MRYVGTTTSAMYLLKLEKKLHFGCEIPHTYTLLDVLSGPVVEGRKGPHPPQMDGIV